MSIQQALDDLKDKINDLGDDPWRRKTIEFLKKTCSNLTSKKEFLRNYQEISMFEMYNVLDSLSNDEKKLVTNYFLDIDNIQSGINTARLNLKSLGNSEETEGDGDGDKKQEGGQGMGDPAAMAGMASGMGGPPGMPPGMGGPAAMATGAGDVPTLDIVNVKKGESINRGHALDILEIYSEKVNEMLDEDTQVQDSLQDTSLSLKKVFRDFFLANKAENLRYVLYPISKYAGLSHRMLLETIVKSHLDDYMKLYFSSLPSLTTDTQISTLQNNMFTVFVKMMSEIINVTTEASKYTLDDEIKKLYEENKPQQLEGHNFEDLLKNADFKPKLKELEKIAKEKNSEFTMNELTKKENSEATYAALNETLNDENVLRGAAHFPDKVEEMPKTDVKQVEATESTNDGEGEILSDDDGDDSVDSGLVTISDSDDDGDSGIDSDLVPFSDSDEE